MRHAEENVLCIVGTRAIKRVSIEKRNARINLLAQNIYYLFDSNLFSVNIRSTSRGITGDWGLGMKPFDSILFHRGNNSLSLLQ